MSTQPNPSRFLAFHTIIAFGVATAVLSLFFIGWLRGGAPQRPANGLLVCAVLLASGLSGLYWFWAWRTSRILPHLVSLKATQPLLEWQRESIRRVMARTQMYSVVFAAILMLSDAVLRRLYPSEPVFVMFYLVVVGLPGFIATFAYRQGLHDAQQEAKNIPLVTTLDDADGEQQPGHP